MPPLNHILQATESRFNVIRSLLASGPCSTVHKLLVSEISCICQPRVVEVFRIKVYIGRNKIRVI
jgi:hypothetical protein